MGTVSGSSARSLVSARDGARPGKSPAPDLSLPAAGRRASTASGIGEWIGKRALRFRSITRWASLSAGEWILRFAGNELQSAAATAATSAASTATTATASTAATASTPTSWQHQNGGGRCGWSQRPAGIERIPGCFRWNHSTVNCFFFLLLQNC